MVPTTVELITREALVTRLTFKVDNACVEFPEEVRPADLLAPKTHNELVQLKVLVGNMLLVCITVLLNKYLGLRASSP